MTAMAIFEGERRVCYFILFCECMKIRKACEESRECSIFWIFDLPKQKVAPLLPGLDKGRTVVGRTRKQKSWIKLCRFSIKM
jgi:hypothetical protein